MNETTSPRAADDGAIRRLVSELVDEAPPASDWSQIEQRAGGPTSTTSMKNTRLGRTRPGLMLAAAAATVALIGGAALVATRGSGTDDRLVPVDSEVPTSFAEEEVIPTTEAPLFVPVTTPTDTTLAEPVPVEPQTDAAPAADPVDGDGGFDDDRDGDVAPDDVLLPVDYPEVALADATSLPGDAWVVAGTLPDGIEARYAIVDLGRRVTYGDAGGRSIEIATDFHPIGGAETLDVDGIVWMFDSFEDSATYTRDIGVITISVSTVDIDRDAAIAVLRDLRAGGDQLLPVDAIRPVDVVRGDNDLVASDDDAFGSAATFRARGVNGWYCTEISYATGSSGGCGDGRNGRLASDVFPLASGLPENGSDRVVLSGIVAPEVVEVEIVLADGTTTDRAAAVDLSGTFEDRFWILEIDLASDDPFVDRFVGIEIRLLAEDGSVLGTAPIAA